MSRRIPHTYSDLVGDSDGSKKQYDMFNQPSDLDSDYENNLFRKTSGTAKKDKDDVMKLIEHEAQIEKQKRIEEKTRLEYLK